PQAVRKLQRQSGREQHFTGCTELNDRAFGTDISFPHHSRQTHRNAHRTSLGKKLGKLGGAALLPDARSARGLCGHCEYLKFSRVDAAWVPRLPVSMA